MHEIRLDGRLVAVVADGHATLLRHVAQLHSGDPLRRFVAAMCLYAIDLDEHRGQVAYCDEDAAAFARELLIPTARLLEHWAEPDARLCKRFAVPLQQLRLRRRQLTASSD